MNKSVRALLIVGVLAVGAGAVLAPRFFGSRARSPVPASEAPAREARTVVGFVVELEELVETLATTGTIRANERIELVSEISGKIEEIYFDEGGTVRAGELLLRLDDQELVAEKERATYRLELALLRENRQLELVDDGLVSQDEYDLALNQVRVLKAELALAEVQLARSKIAAPFTGVVGFRYVSRGSYLAPQTRIATLQDIDPVKVEFTIPEAYIGQIAPGDRVEFHVKGREDSFLGRVYAIEPNVDPETRSLRLRATCPNPDGVLLPGAFADLTLAVRRVEGALTVPSMAVIPELGGRKVFVYTDGVVGERQVETGIRTDTRVQILRGLDPGDTVIVSGLQGLRAGDQVELVAAEDPS